MMRAILEATRSFHSKPRSETLTAAETDGFWAPLFTQTFQEMDDPGRDDLVFYVWRDDGCGGDKHDKHDKHDSPYGVFRRGSAAAPEEGHPGVDWEATFLVNLVLNQIEYELVVAVCKAGGPRVWERAVSVTHYKVFASPESRQMDVKGAATQVCFPNMSFTVDNFDEIFQSTVLMEDEVLAIELVAWIRGGSRDYMGVVFQGMVEYPRLANAFKKRLTRSATSMSKKRIREDLRDTVQFLMLRGGHNKGKAQVAMSIHWLPVTEDLSDEFPDATPDDAQGDGDDADGDEAPADPDAAAAAAASDEEDAFAPPSATPTNSQKGKKKSRWGFKSMLSSAASSISSLTSASSSKSSTESGADNKKETRKKKGKKRKPKVYEVVTEEIMAETKMLNAFISSPWQHIIRQTLVSTQSHPPVLLPTVFDDRIEPDLPPSPSRASSDPSPSSSDPSPSSSDPAPSSSNPAPSSSDPSPSSSDPAPTSDDDPLPQPTSPSESPE